MTARLKILLKRSALGGLLIPASRRLRGWAEIITWGVRGRPIPPPAIVKRRLVFSYGRRFSLRTLVETGTFTGEMVEASKRGFQNIYSIELDERLAERARERFSTLNHISILQGDSKDILPQVLVGIREPALFWLDAHYSGGITAKGETWSPVFEELEAILKHPVSGHVILIDDARGFIGPEADPKMQDLRNLVAAHKPAWCFEIRDDIIRLHADQSLQAS